MANLSPVSNLSPAGVGRGLTALCATVLAALLIAVPPPARAAEREIELNAGLYVIRAEVVDAPETRARGLMYRKSMPANHGMLFVFPDVERQCFWMKNTLIPLSIAFLDDHGVIVNIADMQPQTEDNHCSERAVRYALEMNKGWFAAKRIRPGTKVMGLGQATPQR
ncbi:MAG: DUF192 domain-containing protein [Burkholderiales bacterium]